MLQRLEGRLVGGDDVDACVCACLVVERALRRYKWWWLIDAQRHQSCAERMDRVGLTILCCVSGIDWLTLPFATKMPCLFWAAPFK